MANVSDQIKWTRSSNTQWAVKNHRGYTGVINYLAGSNPYQLIISPGAITTTHQTFRNAKNAYRKFLRDKPL